MITYLPKNKYYYIILGIFNANIINTCFETLLIEVGTRKVKINE
jgi:hypothetical protein